MEISQIIQNRDGYWFKCKEGYGGFLEFEEFQHFSHLIHTGITFDDLYTLVISDIAKQYRSRFPRLCNKKLRSDYM